MHSLPCLRKVPHDLAQSINARDLHRNPSRAVPERGIGLEHGTALSLFPLPKPLLRRTAFLQQYILYLKAYQRTANRDHAAWLEQAAPGQKATHCHNRHAAPDILDHTASATTYGRMQEKS
ncbi:hypothetical protein HNQ38_002217 [Desulfovibrio intestinalis]|uniref:Uncharacterized protein n=1 Tax=Desulfovibrio intestinalis TaxID=58621 RepID=A0A7W8FES5_9BACT|nr:hypothetical protein [Desulfovibrio intestinalis]